MDKDHVARPSGQFLEGAATIDKTAEPSFLWRQTFRMVQQITGDRRDGVGGDEGSAAFRGDVLPDDDGQQALFGAVEEVFEPVSVLVPAGNIGGRSFPRLAFADVEIDDETVPLGEGELDPFLTPQDIADRARRRGVRTP